MHSIIFKNGRLFYLDQTQLPLKEVWRECKSLDSGYRAIKRLEVRGAPLIGVFAAYCIAVISAQLPAKNNFLKKLNEAIAYLKTSRPTAVNLFWALERLEKVILANKDKSPKYITAAILKVAKEIHEQDITLCKNIASYGVKLVKAGDRILTHCNAGFLATSGEGTALAVIYRAHKIYRNIHVYIDETRPLLQGARLSSWELSRRRVPCTLICDNMASYLMQKGKIDKVFVGADRIASNGDAANKIGTYNVAVAAHYHKIPFYVVAPFSTFDLRLASGAMIPIEQRNKDEVRKVLARVYISPKKIDVFNPAFDVTPQHLITAIVTDGGIVYPPYEVNIKKVLRNVV
jgi:methylthioribose-1-phosphate isomerase